MKKIKKDTRKIIEEQLLVEKVRQLKFSGLKISKREIEAFYASYKDSLPSAKESVEVSHILKFVAPSDEAKDSAFRKITDIKKQIDSGADFAKLAMERGWRYSARLQCDLFKNEWGT